MAALLVLALAPSASAAPGYIYNFAGDGINGIDNGAASTASFRGVLGVAVAPNGDVYAADYSDNKVRKISGGTVTNFAGTGSAGSSGDGGLAVNATLREPSDVAVDAAGNVYIADSGNNRIRVVAPSGIISTHPGTASDLSTPYGVAVSPTGGIYVADYGNNRIRRVTAGGTAYTVAGTGSTGGGGDGGWAIWAQLNGPSDVEVDSSGDILIAEYTGNRVRKVSGGIITKLAGTGSAANAGSPVTASTAPLNRPWGIAADTAGNVYVSEISGHVIRRITPLDVMTRVAGTAGSTGSSGDGGPATSALLNSPATPAMGADGDLYFPDYGNRRIRRIEGLGLPGVPTVSGTTPASPRNQNTFTVTGTAAAGSTVRLYTDSDCTSAVAASGTAATFASPGISVTVADNSSTTFYATATNSAGTSECSTTSATYVEDSIAPSDTAITASPAARDNVLSPQWSFSGEGSFECQLSRDGSVVSAYAACTSPKSYAASTEGDYSFSVRATDTAGNVGAPVTSGTYTLDTTGPTAPSITGTPASPSSSRAPVWSWSGELNATYECQFDQAGVPVGTWFICVSGDPQDLTGFADGTYNFSVRPTDEHGNQGTVVTRTYQLDTTPPGQASITAWPASPGNDTTPQWSYSGGSGTYQCRLDRTSAPAAQVDGPGWANCGASPKTYDLSAEVDGTYVFSLRTIDAALNTSTPVTRSFTLDTSVAGTPTITVVPGPVGADRDPEWEWTGDAGGDFECRLDDANGQVSGWNSCSSPHSFNLNGSDGAYTFSVRGTRLGVGGASAEDDYTLDTTAPSPPSVTTPPPATGNSRAPRWTYTAEAGATIECRLDYGATPIHGWTSCPSPYDANLAGADGTYTLTLRATDAAGNTNGMTTSNYVLDTVAPSAPPVDAPAVSLTSNAQPSFTFPTQAGSTYQCRLDGGDGSWSSFTACTSPATYDVAGQPDGVFTFQVKETDAAGNTGLPTTLTWQVDRAGAGVRIDSSPGPVGSRRVVEWSFSSEPGATFECGLVLGGEAIFGRSGCGSPRSYDLAGRADGVYTFSVWATDPAGNAGLPATHSYELDTVAPAKPVVRSTPASPGKDRRPAWGFTAEAGAAIECRIERGGDAISDWSTCTSPQNYDLRSRDDGTYRFLVRARDAAGNLGERAGDNYALDTTEPGAPTINRAPSTNADDVSPTWSFTGEDGATFECQVSRGGDVVERWAACRSPKTFNLSDRRAATYTFSVRATDRAGNTGRPRSDDYVLSAAAANPTAVAPAPTTPTPTPAPSTPEPAPTDPVAPATPEDAPDPGEEEPGKGDGESKDGLAGSGPGDVGPGSAAPDAAAGGASTADARSAAGGGEKAEPKRKGPAAVAHAVTAAVGKAVEVVAKNADKSVFPFSLVMIVFVFLGIQGRIDRSDPKLALAPLHADPDLEFFPPPTEA